MSDIALPRHARVVVVGGGIVGCSVAYHLALMGWTDVVLLEQGQLTSGTTWHAAGLVGQMRANRSMTRMSTYGIDLYARLEQETGLATGWRPCGSVTVARTPERMKLVRRQMALASSFGVEVHDTRRWKWPNGCPCCAPMTCAARCGCLGTAKPTPPT